MQYYITANEITLINHLYKVKVELRAKDFFTHKVVAKCDFYISRTETCLLDKIKTAKQFRRQGIAKNLIDTMENYDNQNNIKYINGIFGPESQDVISAKNFYDEMGYDIVDEGSCLVKILDKKKDKQSTINVPIYWTKTVYKPKSYYEPLDTIKDSTLTQEYNTDLSCLELTKKRP